MRQVILGETIVFTKTFLDSNGDPVDPSDGEVTFRVAKNATTFLTDPATYTAGDVIKNSTGSYQYSYQSNSYTTPGIYNARWDAEIEGVNYVSLETFQITEAPIAPNGLLDPPRHYGVMMESAMYQVLGVGETDRIFLVGHADGLELNDPYQIVNMQEAVNLIGAGYESPMIRALLECYNAGARDIWLVAAAPEGEYVPFTPGSIQDRFDPKAEWDGKNFYERYYDRLETTYSILEGYDAVEIIVPVEAPAFGAGDVDFLGQLAQHCLTSYETTSAIRLGVIGTRLGDFTEDDIQNVIADSKLDLEYGDGGKFVMIAGGEGVFRLPQMPTTHISSIAPTVAARLATSPLDSGLTYKILHTVISPYGRQLSKQEIYDLSNRKVNYLTRTSRGKRGTPFQAVLPSDNTLATTGSDYWAITQMRVVAKVIEEIRALGNASLGTIRFLEFKADVNSYLRTLVMRNEIRDFRVNIERDTQDMNKVIVELALTPYLGVREIVVQVKVGPGV